MTRAENAARVAQLIEGLDWSKATDALVHAFNTGHINCIPDTAFIRPYGECAGEDPNLV